MNIVGFSDLDVADRDSVQVFMDLNELAHAATFDALLETGVVTDHYPLAGFELRSQDFLEVHYREHLSWAVNLGIAAPVGLDAVDFTDPTAVESWLSSHYQHHSLVNQALMIG